MAAPLTSDSRVWSREEAFEYCRRLTKTHYENFTVGSLLLPRAKRQHVSNLYAYARTVDDLGDEAKGDRKEILKEWQEDLGRCYEGTPKHPVMVALQETIRRFDIPVEPFLKLIKANEMDQEIKRYRTFEELLYYCDHSANPCGRLFLYIFNYRDQERHRLADYTCTALQLTNFWQDVTRDWDMRRVYLPMEDMESFSYTEEQLAKGIFNDGFRSLMAFEVNRTRRMFRQGAELVNRVKGASKLDIALFSRGGLAVLDAIEKLDYNVLKRRPHLSRFKKGRLLFLTWVDMLLGRKLRS